jgi:peptidoglycan/LPS O-acetylase OafA/YrhL
VSAAIAVPDTRARTIELDVLRGFAIACMIVDHTVLVFGGPHVLRLTIGRLALPVFFVLAGNLSRRLSWRTAGTLLLGLGLPLLVPWIDNPNVLAWYALGGCLLWAARGTSWGLPVLAAACLTSLANGQGLAFGDGYPGAALVGLMVLGTYVPRSLLVAAGARLPRWLAVLGRWPRAVYVGHLLLLEVLIIGGLT